MGDLTVYLPQLLRDVATRGSSGDFQVAKELARHANVATTQRYAPRSVSDGALDPAYNEIFGNRRQAEIAPPR